MSPTSTHRLADDLSLVHAKDVEDRCLLTNQQAHAL